MMGDDIIINIAHIIDTTCDGSGLDKGIKRNILKIAFINITVEPEIKF